MHVTLWLPRDFGGPITVLEDLNSRATLKALGEDTVMILVPPSGEIRLQSIPSSRDACASYDARWDDGRPVPDGSFGRNKASKRCFYYMFEASRDPRAEYFFVGTLEERDEFLREVAWVGM